MQSATIICTADLKSPPFSYFVISIFGDRLKNFLKAPISTNFEGGSARKKNAFLVKTFPKRALKCHFGPCFFKLLHAYRNNLAEKKLFLVLWEISEKQYGRSKKKDDKILKFSNTFWKSAPLEKILDLPLVKIFNQIISKIIQLDLNFADKITSTRISLAELPAFFL